MNSKYLLIKLIIVTLLNIYTFGIPKTYTNDNTSDISGITIQVQEDTEKE